MTTFLNTTAVLPDDLPVRLNAHGAEPFATIDLDEDGRAYLTVRTPAGADALIKAACEAKRLLEEAAAPSLASCGHPANEDGECNCSSWPEPANLAAWGGVL